MTRTLLRQTTRPTLFSTAQSLHPTVPRKSPLERPRPLFTPLPQARPAASLRPLARAVDLHRRQGPLILLQ